MFEGKNIGAIVVAAGAGTRMGTIPAKQFLELEGKPVIVHALGAFQNSPLMDRVVVVCRNEDVKTLEELVSVHRLSKVDRIVGGGPERQDSVWNGIRTFEGRRPEIVLVHDGVRPFVQQKLIRSVTRAAIEAGAAVPGVHSKDTVKASNGGIFVDRTLDRNNIWLVQTPQAFQFDLLYDAYRRALADKFYGTDDAALVERMGKSIRIVEGNHENIKITTPEDLVLAHVIAKTFHGEPVGS